MPKYITEQQDRIEEMIKKFKESPCEDMDEFLQIVRALQEQGEDLLYEVEKKVKEMVNN